MQEAVTEAARTGAAASKNLIASLELPALTVRELSCGCASERQMYRWLAHYDLQPYHPSDQQRLAGLLLTLIDEVAQWQAPAERRLPMLELLREYTLACVDAMAIQRGVLARAQTPELREAVLLALRMLRQLGAAYASIAAQLAGDGGVALLVRGRRACSLHRAVDSQRRQVRIAALFGLATPKRCWRDMQLLLRLAQLHRVDGKRVTDSLHPRGRDSTARAYLQAALFASANPVQLSGEEQDRLWDLSHDWGRAAKIIANYTEMRDGLLACLNLDQPPVPANRLGSCKVDLRHFSGSRGWKVDLAGVLTLLDKQLQKHADPLLERARNGWAAHSGRTARRTPLQQHCDIAIGIGAISFHLGGSGGPALPDGFLPRGEADRDHLCLDVDSVDYASGKTINEYDVSLPSAPSLRRDACVSSDRGAEQRYRPEQANVLNSSAHGLGLSLPQAVGDRLRVGELVGVRLQDRWQVAVIRWQFTMPDHSRAGIEILAAEALPVKVQRHTSAGHLSAPIAALLLKAAQEETPSLILPVPLFKVYDTVELLAESQCYPVTLQRQLMGTGTFARFEYV